MAIKVFFVNCPALKGDTHLDLLKSNSTAAVYIA